MYEPIKYSKVGSIMERKIFPIHKPNPVMEAKPVFYRADGTGRDTYVETNSGGINGVFSHPEYRENFKASLRQYKKSYAGVGSYKRPTTAVVTKGKSLTSIGKGKKKEKPIVVLFAPYQKDLDSRLSMPKH